MKPDMRELDEIVEKVLPKSDNCFCKDSPYDCASCLANSQVDSDRVRVFEAIKSGLLCEPMTVEEIRKLLLPHFAYRMTYEIMEQIAESIHQVQMRRKT